MTIILAIIAGIFSFFGTIQPFFWVPNRYSAPLWSGDTRITDHFIQSTDLYIGASQMHKNHVHAKSADLAFCLYQAITAGFFAEISIPFTALRIYTDTIPAFNQRGGLCYGNGALLFGWGINYDQLPFFDFIDYMVRTGAITPAHNPIQYAYKETVYGYPQWGTAIASDITAGICEWMTFGFHGSIMHFTHDTTVWRLQPYFKADHCVYGFSFWFGYSYITATTHPTILFPIASHWSMHTVHYGIEYECIQAEFPLHPRIGFYYNQPVVSHNSLKRPNFGLTVGLDLTW